MQKCEGPSPSFLSLSELVQETCPSCAEGEKLQSAPVCLGFSVHFSGFKACNDRDIQELSFLDMFCHV